MGLDLTLGGLVLLMGLRGWFKGFVLQAIRLAGLVACVYLADPVRDLAKPRVIGYLPTIPLGLVDRLLWWTSAVVSYMVLVGVATLAVKMLRRKPLSDTETPRHDQFAGFLLGLAKGLLVAAFVTAGIQKHALDHIQALPWVVRQTETSRALAWNEKVQPVARFWAIPPVRHYVNHIQRMGLNAPGERTAPDEPVASANRAPHLNLPPRAAVDLATQGLDPEVAQTIESIEAEIRKLQDAERNSR